MGNIELPMDKPQEPTSVEPTKLWNVLIYMAADNNLKEESVYALTEILRSVANPEVGIIAQFDSGDADTIYDFTDPSVRKSIADLGLRSLDVIGKPVITDPAVRSLLSDATKLEKFLDTNVDGKCFNLIVLSGHGDGAVGDFLSSNNPPSALSITDVGSVLDSAKGKIGRPVDVLGMDSCLMSMVEVCYGLRGAARFLVGAEGFARNAGWPYYEILTALQGNSKMPPEELARRIVKEYIHFYAPYTVSGVSVDQSACELEQMGNLGSAMRTLSETLRDELKQKNKKVEDAILLAHWRAQSYKLEQYVDLWDFCELLKLKCEEDGEDSVADACKYVQTNIKNVVLLSCYSGSAFQYSNGLSVYFPWAKADLDRNLPFYSNLAFAKETRWDEFLAIYGEQTQREPNKATRNKSGKPVERTMSVETDIGVGVLTGRVKTNLMEGTKQNLMEGTKGGRIIIPMVKNQPDTFLKYEDDCAEGDQSSGKQSAT